MNRINILLYLFTMYVQGEVSQVCDQLAAASEEAAEARTSTSQELEDMLLKVDCMAVPLGVGKGGGVIDR